MARAPVAGDELLRQPCQQRAVVEPRAEEDLDGRTRRVVEGDGRLDAALVALRPGRAP
ncbi:hypothetical protein [Nocardioides sp. B-3]|uniref:hypothetical protein n=1 Tax=Nocardioides sp. B-3 TaxID=2895565 RepID=UPI0021531BD1|nr:hypothetical protein [Nocardioides sp. B-3]UUZ59447.1 hypothetical protein LP418_27280 [Nocardioides sp. B-3]